MNFNNAFNYEILQMFVIHFNGIFRYSMEFKRDQLHVCQNVKACSFPVH